MLCGDATDDALPTGSANELFMNTLTVVIVTDRQAYYYIDLVKFKYNIQPVESE